MSGWCNSHHTYSAKREPNSLCQACWTLFFYRFPERQELRARIRHAQDLVDWLTEREKNLSHEPRETPS